MADRLRHRLHDDQPVVCPGVVDGLSARLVAAAGFEAVYVSGAGTAAARALPDMGLLTLTELADAVRVIAGAAGLPVVVDAGAGFGEAIAIRRTVTELAAAGAAAVHIEDQPFPRGRGYLTGEPCVPVEVMLRRLDAARAAGTDLVLVARTDALLSEGVYAAIGRVLAYRDAGAELIMVKGVRGPEELERIAAAATVPLVYDVPGADPVPALDAATARRLGVKMVIHPLHAARAAAHAVEAYLAALRDGTRPPELMGFDRYMDLAGWADASAFERSLQAGRRS